MSLKDIALLIPAEYRKEILETNMIVKALPKGEDANMYYLGVIWKNYVESTLDPVCNLCYDRVLKNFKAIMPALIEMEQQSNLLKDL